MMDQAALSTDAPARTGIDRTETMLMTFLGIGFSILSLDLFLSYTAISSRFVTTIPPRRLLQIGNWTDPTAVLYVSIGAAVVGLLLAIYRDRQKGSAAAWQKFDYWTTTIIRYFLAYIFLTYGFAKIFHNQFTTSLSVMDTRLADISGFNLTWHFFGYSYAYTLFIASSQILCSLLLFFRRTTTLGAAILIPILSNIEFVNFAYGIHVQVMSSIFLLMALFLLLPEWRRFKALFWDNAPIGAPIFAVAPFRMSTGMVLLKTAVILFLIAMPLVLAPITEGRITKTTTPLAGTWNVEQYKVNGSVQPASDPSTWERLYVENDKQVEIRSGGKPSVNYFTSKFDNAKHTILLAPISRSIVMSGRMHRIPPPSSAYTYRLGPDGTLTLDGQDNKHANIEVTLTRVKSAH